jgi:hypothetical protein
MTLIKGMGVARRIAVAGILALLFGGLFQSASEHTSLPAYAAFNPCSRSGAFFAGRGTSVSTDVYEGVSAHLTYRSDMLCTSYLGNDNYANTWSMVLASDGRSWSQTGQVYFYHIQNNSGCAHHFGQQEANNQVGGPTTVYGSCVYPGETHQVWQQYLSSNGHIRANIDQTVFLETNYVSWTQWAAPLNVTVNGETGYQETDVPGTATQLSDFTQMQVQRFSDDLWDSACGNATFFSNTTLPRYSDTAVACDHVQVWTNNPNGY